MKNAITSNLCHVWLVTLYTRIHLLFYTLGAYSYVDMCEIYINMQVGLKNFAFFPQPSFGCYKAQSAHSLLSTCAYRVVHINISDVHVWQWEKAPVCMLQILFAFSQNLFMCKNICTYLQIHFSGECFCVYFIFMKWFYNILDCTI